MPKLILTDLAAMVRHGSPTRLQPVETAARMREKLNVDATEPGRTQMRPAARALFEKGASGDTDWPRSLNSST